MIKHEEPHPRIVMSATLNEKIIHATPERLYRAFTDPQALEAWQVPATMTGKVHRFDLREGGGYTMSLFYPEGTAQGKSGGNEDRYTAVFRELVPNRRIVLATHFDTKDVAMQGEMIMQVDLLPHGDGTLVRIAFDNIPPGVSPDDNRAGTESSLAKLAAYVEADGARPYVSVRHSHSNGPKR